VYALIPDVKMLEAHLSNFCASCEADEVCPAFPAPLVSASESDGRQVVLFERATFLVISSARSRQQVDVHRFEKISTIIKQFKLSCTKGQAQFQSIELRNKNFTAFIDMFTSNTYVMVVMSDPQIGVFRDPSLDAARADVPAESAATLLNIQTARAHFEKFIKQTRPGETGVY
jgi:Ras-related GTP-binding protein A/B